MASTNPVSPKAVWAGIGAAVLPIVVELISLLIGWISTPDGRSLIVTFPTWVQYTIRGLAPIVGAILGAYLKVDPLRLPTADAEAVAALNTPTSPGENS